MRFPADEKAAWQWADQLKAALWQGECQHLVTQVRTAGLTPSYFEEQQRRRDYPAFRAHGYPIGSGTTESGVKQYPQRLCGTGMRWSRQGLNRRVMLRSAGMEGSFDQRWAAA